MNCFSSTVVSSSSSCSQEDILESIAATCHREATGYVVDNWLQNGKCTRKMFRRARHADPPVDGDCRRQMHAWCVQVVDICKLSRESVEITMSIVDRFVATSAGTEARNDRLTYQLACMSALYTAAKIHETMAISPSMMAKFSHGLFTTNDIEDMESVILDALQWRVNPPTSWDFIRLMMNLLGTTSHVLFLNPDLVAVVSDLAFYQAELAVANEQFLSVKASTIAYAAIMNALESVGMDLNSINLLGNFLALPLQLNLYTQHHVMLVQTILYQSVAQGQQLQQNVDQLCGLLHNAKNDNHSNSASNISSGMSSFVATSPRAVSHAH